MHNVTCTGRNRLTQPIQKQGKRNHAGERPSTMPMADNPTALHIAGWPGNTIRMKLAQQQSIGHTALATIPPAVCAISQLWMTLGKAAYAMCSQQSLDRTRQEVWWVAPYSHMAQWGQIQAMVCAPARWACRQLLQASRAWQCSNLCLFGLPAHASCMGGHNARAEVRPCSISNMPTTATRLRRSP
jgi:hypothetical protein